MSYLYYVAEYWRTPAAEVSWQFFNPPLYYFSVAVFQRLTGLGLIQAGRVFNLLLALLTLGLLAGLCRQVWRDDAWPTWWWLGFYVCNPTVYRVFGMLRPEVLLMPLFVATAWFIIKFRPQTHGIVWMLGSGLLAGIGWGVRQWGIFLEIALVMWAVVTYIQSRLFKQWLPWIFLLGQVAIFVGLAVFFLHLRGGNVLSFNAKPHPIDPAFITHIDLPTLFTNPVRPALDYQFWPVLYADFWGDYWRYWREALEADPLPTSAATRAALARAMWAAIPATVLTLSGWLGLGQTADGDDDVKCSLHRFSFWLVAGSLGCFLIFAGVYALVGKGDTSKSIYLVYLIPFLGYLGSTVVFRLTRSTHLKRGSVPVGVAMALLAVFVAPTGVYSPPTRRASHTWVMPQVSYPLDVTFGEIITLVGYDWSWDAGQDQLTLNLIWRADAYPGTSYKVTVRSVDVTTGRFWAQSDAVPARWKRPTQEWYVGEYITDTHSLALSPEALSIGEIRVGLYRQWAEGHLMTDSGGDYAVIVLQDKRK
ncbi:MAG: hypothetical protein JXA21_25555 [Anaerolineae bacterium]|nr:hypothetical protein [Anaerolineae bacterium]